MHPTHKKVKVSIRLRPGDKEVWKASEDGVWHASGHKRVVYSGFESVLSGVTNTEVYELCVKGEVEKFLCRENCTVFAYGQTGSGKTYTMLGGAEEGIIQLAIRDILGRRPVGISYLEIYNEKLFDLASNREVQMFSVGAKNVISNLWVEDVSSWEEAGPFIERCERNRRFGITEFNTKSSRSHTVMQVTYSDGGGTRTLNMIDLAGSERASRSTDRLREGAFINKSLLALCTVVNNIGNGKYMGFRNSKLTRVLQPALDGSTNLVAICTLSPQQDCVEESISTLKFAARLCSLELRVEEVPMASFLGPRSPASDAKHVCHGAFHGKHEETGDCFETGSMSLQTRCCKPCSGSEECKRRMAGSVRAGEEKDSVARMLNTLGSAVISRLEHKAELLEELNKISNDRIDLLERMVGELLARSPSRRMGEIFILEKHRFNLRRRMVGRR